MVVIMIGLVRYNSILVSAAYILCDHLVGYLLRCLKY